MFGEVISTAAEFVVDFIIVSLSVNILDMKEVGPCAFFMVFMLVIGVGTLLSRTFGCMSLASFSWFNFIIPLTIILMRMSTATSINA